MTKGDATYFNNHLSDGQIFEGIFLTRTYVKEHEHNKGQVYQIK